MQWLVHLMLTLRTQMFETFFDKAVTNLIYCYRLVVRDDCKFKLHMEKNVHTTESGFGKDKSRWLWLSPWVLTLWCVARSYSRDFSEVNHCTVQRGTHHPTMRTDALSSDCSPADNKWGKKLLARKGGVSDAGNPSYTGRKAKSF